MTNREKLMQMSDEDFAKLLCRAEPNCTRCPVCDICDLDNIVDDEPKSMTKWLREEAEDD